MGCSNAKPSIFFFPRQIKWLGKGCLGHTFLFENNSTKIQYVKKVLRMDEYSLPELNHTVAFIS